MSQGANRRADRTNRVVLTGLGVVAIAVGGAGLVLSTTSDGEGADRILTSGQTDWLAAHGGLVGVAVLAVAAVVAILAVQWLRRQLVPLPQAADMTLARGPAGVSVLRTDALLHAIERDVERSDQVSRARAARRTRTPATVELFVQVSDRADLGRVGADIVRQVLPRARRATGRDDLELLVEFSTVATPPAPRVQ